MPKFGADPGRWISSATGPVPNALRGMPSGVMVIDGEGRVRMMNRSIVEMLGLDAAGEGKSFASVVSDLRLIDFVERQLTSRKAEADLVICVAGTGGKECHLRCNLSRPSAADTNHLLLVVDDITEQIQARAELFESEERFRVAFGHAAVGLAHVARDGRWLRVNQKLQDIVGYSEEELRHLTFQDLTPLEDRKADQELIKRLLSGEIPSYSREKRYIHKAGHLVWVKVTVAPMPIGDDQITFISVIEDISPRKQFEQELLHMARHDPLTGLSNRVLLLERLTEAIAATRDAGNSLAVLCIDLDRFKNIVDSLGHEVGDQVIVEVGHRLSLVAGSRDAVARLGGDEFVVMLQNVEREGEVAVLAQEILASLFVPMHLLGYELSPVGSIGISMFPKDGTDGHTLLKNADAAMYRAKDAGRGNFQFYTQKMSSRTVDRLRLEGGLRHALERNEFVLHYQPQIDLSTGEFVGVEALLRWQPPGQALVLPDDFISIAEDTGLIVPIGEWVLRTACAQSMAWRNAGYRDLRMAVNLSARQFKQQELEQMILRVLRETGCSTGSLDLEITESVIMENPESAAETMHRLTDMGVQLSIDDFGTGYSSLSYLKRFPIHSLKIDRSFVRDITTNPDDAAIAKAIIALGHSMKLKVVAEGVESLEQMNFLREQRCDHMQGHYFSKALPPARVQELFCFA